MRVSILSPFHSTAVRTKAASAAVVKRRDSVGIFAAVTALYLFGFLFLFGDLSIRTGLGASVFVIDDPLAQMLQPRPEPFMYEPIALVDLWVIRYLFSPVNLLLGLSLSVLVGLNLALSYLAIRQPQSCGVAPASGLLASIPALLAGSACCAPVLLLVLGIQASALLLTVFAWLLPVGIALLIGSLVYLATRVDPMASHQ